MRETEYGTKVAEVGDVVKCMGMEVEIGSIISQEYYKEEGFGIAFKDKRGNCRYWKQWCDGGELIPCVKPERKTMVDLLKVRTDIQEVVEHCLSYFADRLFAGGSDEWAEIEMLCEDIGTDDDSLKEMFNQLGYEREEK